MADKSSDKKGTAKARYEQLKRGREPYLERARKCAKLTVPSLLPAAGSSTTTAFETPYQGLGARGVNNLAAKLLLALLPPNTPFFRLMLDDFTVEELSQSQEAQAEVEKGLNKIERAVQTEIETNAIRVSSFEGLKHLVVSGNALLYLPDEGGQRVFRLDRYVVARDPLGNVLEILTEEDVAPMALDEDVRRACLDDNPSKDEDDPQAADKETQLYTHARKIGKKWSIYQEINGIRVPDSEGTLKEDNFPYVPLRWTKVDGEDYGRSYIEEYLGDLVSLEELTKAIVEGSAAAAKILFLTDPGGVTRPKDIADAPNMAVRAGSANDVTVLQLQKHADFSVALETLQRLEQRLAFAFLLNTAIQRPGERVTAEEIRFMAGELEDALGGVYSVLSQEFQLPLVKRLMAQMSKQKRLPALPDDLIQPAITTGLEALGRGHDLQKYQLFLNAIAPMSDMVGQYINGGDLIQRIGTALGINTDGLIKSPEQMQQEAQQAQMQQAMSDLGPEAMKMAAQAAQTQQ